ncbi:MAG: hypothetical protein J0H17_17570 [Rhizobiales bacterium]|nr:hypothetical protein [Hyphomicrobiales bacterium]
MHDPIVTDSVTTLGPDPRGCAALAASHGGLYAAYLAAKAELKAVILSDAGVGRERAGIAGLDLLENLGMPAATIGHRSARIGDGKDSLARGVISFVNGRAHALGVKAGMTAQAALDILAGADIAPPRAPTPMHETRHDIAKASAPQVNVVTLDSNALVTPQDAGHIIVTGSHGGLLGGRPQTAVKYDVFAALYNDADIGIDGAGISRLPALDARGIAGATISAWSARIGDGQSTYNDGFVSALNARAVRCGGEIGISAKELVGRLVAARVKELKA